MEVTSTAFVGSFTSREQFPRELLPEIAFVGRSNVGKSSLINKLLGVRRLALISSTPGKTRKINFFRINENIFFVDLPGYGYAKVSKTERSSWATMIEGYLLSERDLRLLILLIDARHGALPNDLQMIEWLDHQRLPYLPVLTKADKLKQGEVARLRRLIKKPEADLHGAVLCSARSGAGMKDIWGAIDASVRK
jgi:GTP-binding protein